MSQRLKLNLGCGDRYAPGWVNVDFGTPHVVDEVVDLRGALPWSELDVMHVYMGHVLEHLTLDDCERLLTRLLPCMVYLGEIMVVGPDVLRAERMIADGTFDFSWGHTLESLRHGGGRWSGDEHMWECNEMKVVDLLTKTGWTDIKTMSIDEVSSYWPVADRAPRWQCAVTAKRPG